VAMLKLNGTLKGNVTFIGVNLVKGALLLAAAVLTGMLVNSGGDGLGLIIGLCVVASLLGVLFVVPIGGADMPVVISLLNSYSGLAASAAGFVIGNTVLIVSGSLVGASGLILTSIMCKAMNRSLANVLFSGFGSGDSGGGSGGASAVQGEAKPITAEDAYYVLEAASSVMFVPGYGMAVAQAQHTVYEITKALRAKKINVRFGIHPVAGRMPGHMNVLLAEARVPYDIVFEMDEVNDDFPNVDVSIVIGAIDIVNPSALEVPDSPIAGMPVLECWKGKSTIVLKRSMATGYAGVQNPLFFKENTRMLFGDAKDSLEEVLKAL